MTPPPPTTGRLPERTTAQGLRLLNPGTGDAGLAISGGVVYGGLLHIAGHVGFRPGTSLPISLDITEQTRQIFTDLDALMASAGTNREHIVFMRIFLHDVQRDFAAMNHIFRQWIGEHRPARTTVGAALAVPGLLIEIDAVVAVPPAPAPAPSHQP